MPNRLLWLTAEPVIMSDATGAVMSLGVGILGIPNTRARARPGCDGGVRCHRCQCKDMRRPFRVATRLTARLPGWWVRSRSLGSLGNGVARDRHRYLHGIPNLGGRKPNPGVWVLPLIGATLFVSFFHSRGIYCCTCSGVTAPLVGMTRGREKRRFLLALLAGDMVGRHVARGEGSLGAGSGGDMSAQEVFVAFLLRECRLFCAKILPFWCVLLAS